MISELCIRRPVMTILLMVSLITAGLFAYRELPVAAVPRVDFPTIQVTATLPGASPETMASSVAAVLEKRFSTIADVTSMSSTSMLGSTSITLQFDLNRNIDGAALDVQSALSSAQRALPDDMTTPPSFRKVNPADQPILFLALTSKQARLSDIDGFAQSTILPQLSTLPGVAQVQVFGSQKYAVRVEADLDQLTARGLTISDIQTALQSANSSQPVGSMTEGSRTAILDATGPITKAAGYMPIVVTWQNGAPVRVSDVATAYDSVENDQTASWQNGTRGIVLAVQRQPDANTVDVVDKVKATLPQIRSSLPAGVDLAVMNDRSLSIRHSIEDVQFTLGLSIVLVVLVIYFFLRTARATLIPAIALPISLIGTFAGMWLLDLSIDNISLLGLTLCVGFVVDDAIVMLENIMRHVEDGEEPFQAALKGSREVGFTIISMTLSLIAVFIPIMFMGGVVGRLFSEFGYVIALAILISCLVSLTLTPMLCARLIRAHDETRREPLILRLFEASFGGLTRLYTATLRWAVNMPAVMLTITAATFIVTVLLFNAIPKGFFPQEDTGLISAQTAGPDDVSFPAMAARQQALADTISRDPDITQVTSTVGGGATSSTGAGRLFITMRDKPARKSTVTEVIDRLRKASREVPGIDVYFQPVQSISVGGFSSRSQYQFSLQSADVATLREAAVKVEARMRTVPGIIDVNSDQQIKARDAVIEIDRSAASSFGLTINDIRNTLYAAYGTRQVSTIYAPEDTYAVILEAAEKFSNTKEMLRKLNIKAANGTLIPLDSVAHVTMKPSSLSLSHIGQLPAVTISFNLPKGASLGEAVERIQSAVGELNLPATIMTSFQGAAQQFQDTTGNTGLLLFAAILVVYIVLGILYESFIHPLTILSGLPTAGIGALLTLELFQMELSVIAMIGLIMLIGIVKKNAIMMVDFAVERRSLGLSAKDAIVEAATLRFRPIMMTTLAAILGVLPIALGTGAGAELRQPLGVTVVGGLMLSQLLTLYITPVVYLTMENIADRFRRKPAAHPAHQLHELREPEMHKPQPGLAAAE